MKKLLVFIATIMIMAISGYAMPSYASSDVDQELSFNMEIINETKTQWIQNFFYSENLKIDWTYEVYLPPSYNDSEDQTYPVFYLLHGVWGSAGNWRQAANLFSNGDALADMIGKEFIIVTVDGLNSFYIDKNIYMESAIMNELLPFIKSQYRVSDTREDTFIGGLSMGGYGAARLALKYPQVFGGAILMSPAVWTDPCADDGELVYEDMGLFMTADGSFDRAAWDDFHPTAYLEDFKSQNLPVRFYIATGDADKVVDIRNVDQFVEQLKDVDAAEVRYVVKNDLEHNWILWKEQILYGIMYCLK